MRNARFIEPMKRRLLTVAGAAQVVRHVARILFPVSPEAQLAACASGTVGATSLSDVIVVARQRHIAGRHSEVASRIVVITSST
jgi:hypothetical protein